MPTFELSTNVARDAIPENLLASLTEQLAKATGKPAEYIAVHIMPDQLMSFGGTTEPCALCSLKSIGKIGGSQNKDYTNLLSDVLSKELHIQPNSQTEKLEVLGPTYTGLERRRADLMASFWHVAQNIPGRDGSVCWDFIVSRILCRNGFRCEHSLKAILSQ